MQRVPGLLRHDVLDADDAQLAVRLRLVDQRLRLVHVQDAVHEFVVDEMHAHRAELRTGHARGPEDRAVLGQSLLRHVQHDLAHLVHDRREVGRVVAVVVCRGPLRRPRAATRTRWRPPAAAGPKSSDSLSYRFLPRLWVTVCDAGPDARPSRTLPAFRGHPRPQTPACVRSTAEVRINLRSGDRIGRATQVAPAAPPNCGRRCTQSR